MVYKRIVCVLSTIFDKHAVFALFAEMCWYVHSNAADSREDGPSTTRGGYLLTQWNLATLLVGGLL